MNEFYNKHYITVDGKGRIGDGWSNGPKPDKDISDAVCINEQGGYQFRLFPGGEENPPLYTMDGIPLYRWDGERAAPRTEGEIAADRAEIPASPPSEQERLRTELDAMAPGVEAAAVTFCLMAEAGQVDAATAGERAALFSAWGAGVDYKAGQLRRRGGALYRCLQAHRSQEGWEPESAPSLWKLAHDPGEPWPEWSQPICAGDEYNQGAKVAHGGKHWVSDVDGNVWEPGVYGWSPAEDG